MSCTCCSAGNWAQTRRATLSLDSPLTPGSSCLFYKYPQGGLLSPSTIQPYFFSIIAREHLSFSFLPFLCKGLKRTVAVLSDRHQNILLWDFSLLQHHFKFGSFMLLFNSLRKVWYISLSPALILQ